jgi:hypothetical protein
MTQITLEKLKEFCKLAELKCSGLKDDVKDRVEEYLNKYKYAPRYLRGLTLEEKFEKKFDIKYNQLKEKNTGKKSYSPLRTDTKKSFKYSKYTENWNKTYKNTKTIQEKSKISGVPLDILKKVNDKGLAAWRGGQHRPGASQQSWGISRVNSFLTCGKTFYFPDHKLAKEAMKRSPKAKNFWKKKGCKFSKMGKRTPSR